MTTTPHTKDIGIAIRDALDLIDEIETFDWDSPDDVTTGDWVEMGHVDASDASNLLVTVGTATFRVIITRVDAPRPAEEDDGEDPIRLGSYLVQRGYTLIETGGNCRAWVRIMADGEHVVVTDAQGIAEPDETDWMIGRYATEDWTDGYNAQPDEEGDKTLDAFIAALDRAEAHTLAELLAGE